MRGKKKRIVYKSMLKNEKKDATVKIHTKAE
jgi:hypothetical protein